MYLYVYSDNTCELRNDISTEDMLMIDMDELQVFEVEDCKRVLADGDAVPMEVT